MDDLLTVLQPVNVDYSSLLDCELADLARLHDVIAQNDAVFGCIPGSWLYIQALDAERRKRENAALFAAIPHYSNLSSGRGGYLRLLAACGDSVQAAAYDHRRP